MTHSELTGVRLAAMVNVVNYYLDPEKPADVQTLCARSKLDAPLDPKDEALLQGFVLEGGRTLLRFLKVIRRH